MNEKKLEKKFICIECCERIHSIFKIYQDGFQDIIECVSLIKIRLVKNLF